MAALSAEAALSAANVISATSAQLPKNVVVVFDNDNNVKTVAETLLMVSQPPDVRAHVSLKNQSTFKTIAETLLVDYQAHCRPPDGRADFSVKNQHTFILSGVITKEGKCRGFGGHHKSFCQQREIKKQSKSNRVAIAEGFYKKVQEKKTEIQGVLQLMQTKRGLGGHLESFGQQSEIKKQCKSNRVPIAKGVYKKQKHREVEKRLPTPTETSLGTD